MIMIKKNKEEEEERKESKQHKYATSKGTKRTNLKVFGPTIPT